MTNLTQLTLSDAVDGLKAKKFSSKEITQAFLTEIGKSNPHLNAYVVVTADKALKMAEASDAKLKAGKAGNNIGANAFPFVEFVNGTFRYQAANVTIEPTGKTTTLAKTQTAESALGRPLVDQLEGAR